ncbi:MAG: hypothetical protein HWD81_01300 [Marivivens sp.]|nr:hypothetical protein [Marivivens sp.]
MTKAKLLATLAFVALPTFAAAEFEISGYTGIQEAPHAKVTGNEPDNGVSTNLNFGCLRDRYLSLWHAGLLGYPCSH